MTVNEMNKYIGKEYWFCPPVCTYYKVPHELFAICPERNVAILDALDLGDRYEYPLDTFPFENYVKEEN